HFRTRAIPKNISIIPNRVNRALLSLENKEKTKANLDKLRIGFVGLIRYTSILNFADVFANEFPSFEFHFFGNLINDNVQVDHLKNSHNIFFHGEFDNPSDLPGIYNSI